MGYSLFTSEVTRYFIGILKELSAALAASDLDTVKLKQGEMRTEERLAHGALITRFSLPVR